MSIGAAEIRCLGDGDGDDRHVGAAQIVEVGLVLNCAVNRRERSDQLEAVALTATGDQGVKAVLRLKCVGHVGSPAGKGRDAPLVGIGAVGGVPRLMGSMEVA